jgi:hypothetical protein
MRLFRGKSIAVPAEALHSYPQAPWPPVHRSLTAWRDPSHRPTAAAKLRSESQSRSLLASGALTVDQLLDRWLIDRRITARSYSSWLANRLDVTCWKKVARPSMRGRRMAESSRPATPNTSAEPSLCPTPPCDFWNANATGRPNGNGVLGTGWLDNEGYVFTMPNGGWIHQSSLMRAFERTQHEAGVPRMRVHNLRHTGATLLLLAGIHPKVCRRCWATRRCGPRWTGTATSCPV